jgi:hypothetical protein
MRKPVYLLAALALFAAAGCARTDHITAPERRAAPHVNDVGGTSTVTNTTQADTVTRGNGLIGSGG